MPPLLPLPKGRGGHPVPVPPLSIGWQDCPSRINRPSGLSNRNLLSHSSEAGSPRSRCRQGWFLLRPLSWAGGRLPSFCVLPQPPLCAHMYVSGVFPCVPLLIRHQSHWISSHLNGLILTELPLVGSYLQIHLHSEVLAVSTAPYAFGGRLKVQSQGCLGLKDAGGVEHIDLGPLPLPSARRRSWCF